MNVREPKKERTQSSPLARHIIQEHAMVGAAEASTIVWGRHPGGRADP